MNTKFLKPIIFFDLETTGTDVSIDKIVQLSAVKVSPELEIIEAPKTILLNPGRSIPKSASEVHGITDEMVLDKPSFCAYSKNMFRYFEGSDLAGFNIANFDVPLLSEEFARCGINWPQEKVEIFDAFRIFSQKQPRNLSAAVEYYLGATHDGAHDAEADVLATLDVFVSQLRKYEDLSDMTPAELTSYCIGENRVDIAGKIVLNSDGEAVYNFGKHKGEKVISQVGFAEWMLKNNFPMNTKNVVKILIGK